jgi:hypothetical protein
MVVVRSYRRKPSSSYRDALVAQDRRSNVFLHPELLDQLARQMISQISNSAQSASEGCWLGSWSLIRASPSPRVSQQTLALTSVRTLPFELWGRHSVLQVQRHLKAKDQPPLPDSAPHLSSPGARSQPDAGGGVSWVSGNKLQH